jgi:hypothetical protein
MSCTTSATSATAQHDRAAAVARGRWLVLCNNDIEVGPDWLEALIRCGEPALNVGVVTPKYAFSEGRLAEVGAVVRRGGSGWNSWRGGSPDDPAYDFSARLTMARALWRTRSHPGETDYRASSTGAGEGISRPK